MKQQNYNIVVQSLQ